MRNEIMPIIKLELQHMRHTMLQHLELPGGEFAEAMDAELKIAIENFDWDAKMSEACHKAIHQAIDSYFDYGGKGYQFVRDTLEAAFDRMWEHPKKEEK